MMKIRNKVLFAFLFLVGALLCAPNTGRVQAEFRDSFTQYDEKYPADANKSNGMTFSCVQGTKSDINSILSNINWIAQNPEYRNDRPSHSEEASYGSQQIVDYLRRLNDDSYVVVFQVTEGQTPFHVTYGNGYKKTLSGEELYCQDVSANGTKIGTVAVKEQPNSNGYTLGYIVNIPNSVTGEKFVEANHQGISFTSDMLAQGSTYQVKVKYGLYEEKLYINGTYDGGNRYDEGSFHKNAAMNLINQNLDTITLKMGTYIDSHLHSDDYDRTYVLNNASFAMKDLEKSMSTFLQGIPLKDQTNYKDLQWFESPYKFSNTRKYSMLAGRNMCNGVCGSIRKNGDQTEAVYFMIGSFQVYNLYSKATLAAPTTENGITYEIHDNGAYVKNIEPTTNKNGAGNSSVVIPEFITWKGNKYRVNKILADAKISDQVTSLTLPESIYSYPSKVFVNSKLEDVYLESVSATLGDAFPKSVNLHSYSSSAAYEKYEEQGYEGTNIPFSTKVNYHLDGGENNEKNMEYYSFRTVFYPGDAVKEGYRFDGWFFDEDLTKPVTYILENDRSEDEIDIYAKWYELPEETKENTDKADTVDPTEKDNSDTEDNGVIKNLDDADYDNTKPETTGEPVQKVTLQTLDDDSLVATAEDGKTGEGEPATFNIFSAKRKIKVMLENTDAKKYEVQVSTSSKFKKKATKSYKFSADASRMADTTIMKFGKTKLKVGKTYYCRVRSYAVVNGNGKKSYSGWSEVVAVKIVK